MSNDTNQSQTTKVMFSQLLLVSMGLVALLLAAVIVGALADRYYTGRQYRRDVELEKQEAFTQGLTYEDSVRAKREAEEAEILGQEQQAAVESQRQAPATEQSDTPAQFSSQANEAGLSPTGEPLLVPPPDFNIGQEEIQAMMRKEAIIHTTMGSIPIEFRPDVAPRTVKNFLHLASKGFYNGMAFYREYPGVFVQTGSPTGLRGGSAGYSFRRERNILAPDKGTLAFLVLDDEENTGSEFCVFISAGVSMVDLCAVFARVKERYDVVEKITDSKADKDGYLADRAYITRIEIIEKGSSQDSSASTVN